ncbi:MAG: hypothetical protein KC592_11285 [Nitrospira sp.]|nr:hypothetical protein [Nitrospira sp.]
MNWEDLQSEISKCEECISRWRGHIADPLSMGEIPDPPAKVKVLFVGVAPTNRIGRNRGEHFYSSTRDNLRRELFRLLHDHFDVPVKGLPLEMGNSVFHGEGYFFVHAAKVRPVGQDAPPSEALLYCANRHLKAEITILAPQAVCFLGITNLGPVAFSLLNRRVSETAIRVSFCGWTGWVGLAPQPVRGNRERTGLVIAKLLSLIG